MNRLFSKIAGGLVWSTLPLTGGLYYWEHSLQMSASSHKVIQIILLPAIIGWAYFWNKQADEVRIPPRLELGVEPSKTPYRRPIPSTWGEEPAFSEPSACDPGSMAPEDHAGAGFDRAKSFFEVTNHVSNN